MRALKPVIPKPVAPAKLSEQMEYLNATPEERKIMDQRYQLKAPGLVGTQTTAAALGDRTTAELAAKAAKEAADLEEKRVASRLQLEKDVAAEYTGSKLALEPAYQEALTNAAKKIKGAKTPDEVRREIIAREVERRAGTRSSAAGAGKQKVIKLD
jgi:hypothetical protein